MTRRILVLGATGGLGTHVVRQALQAGHAVSVVARSPGKLAADLQGRVTSHQADIAGTAPSDLAQVMRGHDALINCAGFVADGHAFVRLVDSIVAAAESLAVAERPVCWFLAGAGLLDIDDRGRRALDLPRVRDRYWPHARNYERIRRSHLDWRILCPGPMVQADPVGLSRLRVSFERLPVQTPGFIARLPDLLALALFARRVPEMIVPYADAAALMLAHLAPNDASARHRVGLALPLGTRGSKPRWTADS